MNKHQERNKDKKTKQLFTIGTWNIKRDLVRREDELKEIQEKSAKLLVQ